MRYLDCECCRSPLLPSESPKNFSEAPTVLTRKPAAHAELQAARELAGRNMTAPRAP